MIQEKSGGPWSSMTQKESFDEFYTRKLSSLIVQLKEVIKGDVPYVTSAVYACAICSGRIKLHSQERIYCLMCQAPPSWSPVLKSAVFHILQDYPSYEESVQEWNTMRQAPTVRQAREDVSIGRNRDLGKKIEDARKARNMSRQDLANKIFKRDGKERISGKSIEGYEIGLVRPPKHIAEQLEQVLGLEGLQDAR